MSGWRTTNADCVETLSECSPSRRSNANIAVTSASPHRVKVYREKCSPRNGAKSKRRRREKAGLSDDCFLMSKAKVFAIIAEEEPSAGDEGECGKRQIEKTGAPRLFLSRLATPFCVLAVCEQTSRRAIPGYPSTLIECCD